MFSCDNIKFARIVQCWYSLQRGTLYIKVHQDNSVKTAYNTSVSVSGKKGYIFQAISVGAPESKCRICLDLELLASGDWKCGRRMRHSWKKTINVALAFFHTLSLLKLFFPMNVVSKIERVGCKSQPTDSNWRPHWAYSESEYFILKFGCGLRFTTCQSDKNTKKLWTQNQSSQRYLGRIFGQFRAIILTSHTVNTCIVTVRHTG